VCIGAEIAMSRAARNVASSSVSTEVSTASGLKPASRSVASGEARLSGWWPSS
jgi:hypothetical protein